MTLKAGSKITLKPGFHAKSGSEFYAQIDPNIGSEPGNYISYTYNQAGNRIAKSTSDNVTLHYIRGMDGQTIAVLDENDSPLFYNIAGVGKLAPDGGSGDMSYYYLTDHLGSIRVIIEEDGTVLSHTDYYPFGMQIPGRVMSSLSHDFFKYIGKQLDDEYGLNWLDFGWRPLDPEIGRWVNVDPLAGANPAWSPYAYAYNSPMVFIDIDGLLGFRNDSTGVYEWFDEDPGEGWTLVYDNDDRDTWDRMITFVNAVREYLIELGFSEEDVNRDVAIQTDPFYQQYYAKLSGEVADRYISNWSRSLLDSRSNTNDASQSNPIGLYYWHSRTVYSHTMALKYYPSRANSIGIVRVGLSHYAEAALELVDGVLRDMTGVDNLIYDMHLDNSTIFLRYLRAVNQGKIGYRSFK